MRHLSFLASTRSNLIPWALSLGLILVGASVGSAQPSFSDQTTAAGLDYTYMLPSDLMDLPMLGGATVGDFNVDGWPDLFVVGGGMTAGALFINDKDGTFHNSTVSAKLDGLYRGVAAAAADYDGDGLPDIFVTTRGSMQGDPANGDHKLFHNNGDGTFTNVATAAGVNSTASYPDGFGIAWGDYDLDGDLDLNVGGWHEDAPGSGFAAANKLFRNDGDGTFTDVTDAAGLYIDNTQGFGAIFVDMDGDRYPELLVAGDFGTSKYYRNNRDGTFTEVDFLTPGSTKAHNGMGTTIGDFNRDGLQDWFVTAIDPTWTRGPEPPNCDTPPAPGNRLYQNMGGNEFESLPALAGVNDGGWGWGTAARDFNHDGWLDIIENNGWFNNPHPCNGDVFYNEPAYLWINNQDDTFTEVGQDWGIDYTHQGRALITFDYDRDGDMDIVLLSNPMGDPVNEGPGTGQLKLFRNDLSGPGTRYLEVLLDTSADPSLASEGLGADVQVRKGSATQYWRMAGAPAYLSRGEVIAHFGVGGTTVLDDVVVEWPNGFRTVMTDVPTNQVLTIAAELPFNHGELVRGQTVDMVVDGMLPGEEAIIIFTLAGEGAGPCPPQLGGLCADLLAPRVIGSAIADANGTATLSRSIPASAPDGTAFTQAVILRGAGGETSYKSNVVQSLFVDP